MSQTENLLDISMLSVSYGGIRAVKEISLGVGRGELVCLTGANGAGKGLTLRAICGLTPVAGGQVMRSEERRVGKGCVGRCRSRWARDINKKKTKSKTQIE